MRKVAYALATFLLLVAVCFTANLVLAISGKEHKGGGPSVGANYALSAAYAAVALKTGTQCDSKNIVYAGRSMKGRFKGDWADYIKSASVDGAGITATVSNPVGNWSNSTTLRGLPKQKSNFPCPRKGKRASESKSILTLLHDTQSLPVREGN